MHGLPFRTVDRVSSSATTLVQPDVNGARMDVFLHDVGGLSAVER
jgi:hypothetical protein